MNGSAILSGKPLLENAGQIALWEGLSQILCKRRNAVQIEQNIFKVEVVQAAAALFSK
ncbi:hypothetical protein [Dysosmobacter sp. HCP28S3_G4]|uniref:hypothetical protein n=1 Tax=Dysosmobacter sp. HCP28S3_G4 TaxID=3438938 RepID=UPI003F895BE1